MKELIYVNGHFYDVLTKGRVKIKDEAQITVLTDENISKAEQIGEHPKLKNSEQLEKRIKNNPKIKESKKALERGTRLYFTIPRHSQQLDHEVKHEFEVELLEDLYFYLKKNAKKDDSRLYDCGCVVRKNSSSSIKMFEEIIGKSLNQIFKNTYVHYFGNEGAPSCNAIDRFYEDCGKGLRIINQYRFIEKKEKEELF